MDPDEFIRAYGVEAFKKVIENAVPMVDMLFARALYQGDTKTPEGRAGIEQRLNSDVDRIRDVLVRKHYRQAIRERLAKVFGPLPQRPAKEQRLRDRFAASSALSSSPLTKRDYGKVVSMGALLRDGGRPTREPGDEA